VVVVSLALLPLAIAQRGHHGAEALIKDSGGLGLRIRQVPKQFLVGFDAPAEAVLAVLSAVLCAGAVALLLARGSDEERRVAVVPAVLAVVALAIPLVLALAGLDYLNARNSLAAWIPAFAVVGVGISVAGARWLGTAGAVALCAIGIAVWVGVASDARYQRDDWRGAAKALGRPVSVRAVVFSPGEVEALQLYLPHSRLPPAAGVRELDYLVLARHRAGEERAAPRVEELPRRPPGAVVLERRREETFVLARYRLPRPVAIGTGAPPPLEGKAPAVVVQPP
jgi:hypothetical protein